MKSLYLAVLMGPLAITSTLAQALLVSSASNGSGWLSVDSFTYNADGSPFIDSEPPSIQAGPYYYFPNTGNWYPSTLGIWPPGNLQTSPGIPTPQLVFWGKENGSYDPKAHIVATTSVRISYLAGNLGPDALQEVGLVRDGVDEVLFDLGANLDPIQPGDSVVVAPGEFTFYAHVKNKTLSNNVSQQKTRRLGSNSPIWAVFIDTVSGRTFLNVSDDRVWLFGAAFFEVTVEP